ncbi:Structural maintenance of chromosomes protein 2 [Sorochytrium milnesiophthora]
MYVKEVIIDGFKSYATRTVISGWDPEFNAITGLNGSGKSNILDAICFVLGITTLSHVRAQNLQDLVYKRGQAGINKASVSIVFDNSVRESSPVGYEEYREIVVTRQVVIGGKNKFLINGHLAQQHVVANLFQSVQLNVNNPHFLIMQGKITKVLNMKPPEILSMIEEAAGTRMFEERRDKALRTMERKEKKVQEVQSLLNEEIRPELEKLRGERAAYLEFQKAEIEKQRLERLVVAWEYSRREAILAKSDGKLEKQEQLIQEAEGEHEQLTRSLKEIEAAERDINKKKDSELGAGGKFQELERTEAELKRALTKLQTQHQFKGNALQEEQDGLRAMEKGLQEQAAQVEEQRAQYTQRKQAHEEFQKTYEEQAEHTKKADERLQTLSAGLNAQEGNENGFIMQIQDEKTKISAAEAEADTARQKLKYFRGELPQLEAKYTRAKKEQMSAASELERLVARIAQAEAERGRIQFDPEREEALLQIRATEQEKLQAVRQEIDRAEAQLNHSASFDYSDPSPNFDRSLVKGLAVSLIDLPEHNYDKSTALEICAGGRLFNVIVENEVVASQLLKNGRLRRRVTIIPLNKIQAWKASVKAISTMHEIAGDRANLALNLIGYDDELTPAMEYIFGSTFICADAATAQQLTFHKDIRSRTVTIQGDVYEPSGVMSGGSKPQSSGLLIKIQQVRALKQRMHKIRDTLAKVEQELASMHEQKQAYSTFTRDAELLQHQKTLLEQQVAESEYTKLGNAIAEMKQAQEECQVAITAAERRSLTASQQIKALEKEMAEYKTNRSGKLKDMEKSVEQAKIKLGKLIQQLKTYQREAQTAELELSQAVKDLAAMQTEMEARAAQVAAAEREHEDRARQIAQAEKEYGTALERLSQERQTLSKYDDQLKKLHGEQMAITKQLPDITLTLKQLRAVIDQLLVQKDSAAKDIQDMLRQHPWIADEKGNFGQANTAYSFDMFDAKSSQQRLKELTHNYDQLKKKVNTKVMDMIGVVEKREVSVVDKVKTVQADKLKIEETISKLDTIKKQELEKTWRKVNKDFGAIFGELLPGNTARLEPPEGSTIMDGLEVKVCLGSVWKESLTELSGGQRSLIALSLILSLLQFKPAPMYILDEIDAALDLSHTQNIGQLFKHRFTGSQFIVVSLKEGMFNNANVLFRARFRDGTSMVERIAGKRREKESRASGMSTPATHSRRGTAAGGSRVSQAVAT